MDHAQMVEIFGEVISSYPDSQAVEDGILVPITQQHRVTRACWEWMAENLGSKSPPNSWPVDMLGWFGAETGDDRALAASKGLIGQWERRAREVWDQNIDGGVFMLWARQPTEKTITMLNTEEQEGDTVLWLIPNEMGGVTLMFPSDY